METILTAGLTWITKHVPGLAFVIFLLVSVIWVTVIITDFKHRLSETERVCNDINSRQLPEIRTDIKEMKLEMNRRFSEIDERLLRMERLMIKMDTYLSTKDKDYPK